MKQLYFESAKNTVGYINGVDIWNVFEAPNGMIGCDILINDPFTTEFGWNHEPKIDAMRMEVIMGMWGVEGEVKRNLKESLDNSDK